MRKLLGVTIDAAKASWPATMVLGIAALFLHRHLSPAVHHTQAVQALQGVAYGLIAFSGLVGLVDLILYVASFYIVRAGRLAVEARQVPVGAFVFWAAGETVWPRWFRQPYVTDVSYLERGEGGKPTVYIESSEMPGWAWRLRPDETVVIASSGPLTDVTAAKEADDR